MAVAAEALVAVSAAEFTPDACAGALNQARVLDSPGRIADHREAGAVDFLAGGFPRQQALEGPSQTHDGAMGDQDLGAAIAVFAVEVDAIEGFERCFGHADRAGIALRQPVIALVAPFPDAVVRHPVSPGHVVHQVLNKCRFVAVVDQGETAAGQLCQLQQEQGRGIDLQMSPAVIRNHWLPAGAVVFGMQGIEWIQAALEAFHLPGLAHHRVEQSAHQVHHALLELPAALAGPLHPAMRCRQAPHTLNGIDAVPHPGIAVIAMHGVSRAGRQQSADRVLALQHHGIDRLIQAVQPLQLLDLVFSCRLRQNHGVKRDRT